MRTKNLIGLGAVLVILIGICTYALTRPVPKPSPITSVEDASPLPPKAYEEHKPYYDVAVHYPQVTPLKSRVGTAADARAVATMEAFVMGTIDEFKAQGRFDSLTPKDIEMLGFDQGRKWTLEIVYLISSSPRTVSYIFTVNEDTGGAHGNTFFRTFTFDTQTGAELPLADLFANPDYLATLSSLARAKLPRILGDVLDERLMQDGTAPDAKNFSNFFIDNGTLDILFPPYQVAAYAAGPQTLPIPLTELKDALKSPYRPQ